MAASTDKSVLDANELQQQLEEKDQLVLALTERLEEAAEQLDRAHRSGTDKGGRAGSGAGLAHDALTQQQTLIEQLSKSVEVWEDVQPRDAFARIEARLDEVRRLLQNGDVSRTSAAAPANSAPSQTSATQTPSPEATRQQPQEEEGLSAWEKMKAELMGADTSEAPESTHNPQADVSPEPPPPEPTAPVEPTTPAAPQTLGAHSENPVLEPLAELKLPEPIDFDTAERSALESGIDERDQYIGYLTRRLRAAESRTHQPIDWEALNNAPEQLRATLQQLEADLVDRLRIAEVDLSLERARLSRVETRVRGMQKQIEKRLQSVAGKGPAKNGDAQPVTKDGKRPKSWFGSLGR